MINKTYQYTLDSFVQLAKFIWNARHGNKYVNAFRVYGSGMVGLFSFWIIDVFFDSKGEWRLGVSTSTLTWSEIGLAVVFTVAFVIVLVFMSKPEFEKSEIERLKRIEENQFLHRITPIILLSQFSLTNNLHGVAHYEDSEELARFRELIANNDSGHVRLLGLSGTGKTLHIVKAFEDKGNMENVFYCDQVSHGNFKSALQLLSEKRPGCTVVLDNSPKGVFAEAINSYGNNIRFVSAYYDPVDVDYGSYSVLDMKDIHLENVVERIIDNNLTRPISGENRQKLIIHSGGIPFMALLLTQAYNKTSEIGVINNSVLIEHLLDLHEENANNQRIAMRTIALLQPFDYAGGNSETAKYLIENNKFTPIVDNINRQVLFHKVVKHLKERNLLEEDASYINMRPQPLAIWLVGEWIKEQGSGFIDTIKELAAHPKSFYFPIIDSWARRLEFMQDNADAKKLYGELLKLHEGPFADEDVICSDLGSRLILAMSTVNPKAVVSCLYGILYSKPIDYLKSNLQGEARRNIVNALEKLCFCKDSFHYAALTLARLALAENEEWANNSKGQFLQLFHVALAGTECDLKERMAVLNELYEQKNTYKDLLLGAIKGAFDTYNLSRIGGAERFGFKSLVDFMPTYKQINEYWDSLFNLSVSWMDLEPDVVEYFAEIVCVNARMFVRGNRSDLLFSFIDEIAPRLNYNWGQMQKALIEIKNFDVLTPQNSRTLLSYIDKLKPRSIVTEMRNAVHDIYTHEETSVDILNKEELVVLPFVEKFIAQQKYLSDEIIGLVANDKEYTSWEFTKNVAARIPNGDIPQVLEKIYGYIIRQNSNFYSNWLVRFIKCLPDKHNAQEMAKKLYENGFIKQGIALLAVIDDDAFSNLNFLWEYVATKKLEYESISSYYNVIRLTDVENLLKVVAIIKYHSKESNSVFDFLSQYWYLDVLYEDDRLSSIYKEVLINYDLQSNRTNYEYVRRVERVLEKTNDNKFAKTINSKLIAYLSFNSSILRVEEIYPILLTKFRTVIWDEFIAALVDLDNRPGFFYQIRLAIGSGFGFSERTLFSDHEEEMKEVCKRHSQYGPIVCASLCPILKSSGSGEDNEEFHPFVIWLLNNYGGNKMVLNELYGNMCTFSWNGSMLPLIKTMKNCLLKVRAKAGFHKQVYKWVSDCLKQYEADYNKERQNEAYMRMAYNYKFNNG